MRYLLGLDDTDSRLGHCTTHLAYLLVVALIGAGHSIPGYPRLVRLNPNIPFKTRGNAAVCIELEAEASSEAIMRLVEPILRREADVKNGANPGMVLVEASSSPSLAFFRGTYSRAINGVVNYRGVLRALEEAGTACLTLGNGMGVVGAVASVGFDPSVDDHTYELIAYRTPEACGTPRRLDEGSVRDMDLATFPHTFNNYDHQSGKMLVAPTGPDPVLLGIRGDSPDAVIAAFGSVNLREPSLGYAVFASNQCTDAHLRSELQMPLKAYSAGWLRGTVVSVRVSQGGHMTVRLRTGSHEVDCVVYEPAGDLRRTAKLLVPGDALQFAGGVRPASATHPSVVNVEGMAVLALAPKEVRENPACACGARTKSEGRGKGFQCRACGAKLPERSRVSRTLERPLQAGVYLPSPRAQRHLTKQLVRYGNEAEELHALVERWLALPVPVKIHA